MKKIWTQLQNWADRITAIGVLLGLIIGILSLFLKSFDWTPQNTFQTILKFLGEHLTEVWSITITLVVLFLFLQYIRIRRQLTLVFIDEFKKPLEHSWDYIGSWKITSENELFVAGSDQGGLTKKGSFWENYIFTFETKILKNCIGVVVRAKDMNNYYMFQITTDKIRPHRRISAPTISGSKDHNDNFIINEIKVGWQVLEEISLPHRKNLNTWFKVKLIVNGQSIEIYIDDDQVFNKELLLENGSGKIGFRNSVHEEAIIRKVRVELI